MSKLSPKIESIQIMDELFEFIMKEKLVDNFDSDLIKSKAAEFYGDRYAQILPNMKKKVIKAVENFSLYDLSNYKSFDRDVVPSLVMTLSVFKSAFIRKLINGKDNKKYMDFGSLEKKASPPVEAYEYVGNNKLDISPTNRSHGLLFE